MTTPAPVLIACAHGTRDAAGQAVMGALQAGLAGQRPGLEVRPAHVDVQGPTLEEVVAELTAQGRPMVIVPLLLSTGYHVAVDVAQAVAASGGLAVAAPALGPHPVLVHLLQDRLEQSGAGAWDRVVLAAAGSSDPRAIRDVETTAQALAQLRGVPVTCGYLAASSPTVAEAVAEARAAGGDLPVAVATYLLAPGYFSRVLARAAADTVADPLVPDPSLTRLILHRYDQHTPISPSPRGDHALAPR